MRSCRINLSDIIKDNLENRKKQCTCKQDKGLMHVDFLIKTSKPSRYKKMQNSLKTDNESDIMSLYILL